LRSAQDYALVGCRFSQPRAAQHCAVLEEARQSSGRIAFSEWNALQSHCLITR
jgi:hypothetical protein